LFVSILALQELDVEGYRRSKNRLRGIHEYLPFWNEGLISFISL